LQKVTVVKQAPKRVISQKERDDFDTEFDKALGYPHTTDNVCGVHDSVLKSTTDKDGDEVIPSSVEVVGEDERESPLEKLVRERKERLNV